MTGGLDVHAAVAKFDRGSVTEAESAAEDEQKQVLARFPLEEWAELPLERYALGQGEPPGAGPTGEPLVDGLPRPEPVGKIPPRSGPQPPQHPVDHLPVITPRTAPSVHLRQ